VPEGVVSVGTAFRLFVEGGRSASAVSGGVGFGLFIAIN
jgi:hypothetical protein